MKVYTRREKIQSVLELYDNRYKGEPPTEKRNLLAALDLNTCPPSAINEIMGNTAWTSNKCDGCERDVDAVVQINWYDTFTQYCGWCLSEAVTKLDNAMKAGATL
jgi:hypothetical protein